MLGSQNNLSIYTKHTHKRLNYLLNSMTHSTHRLVNLVTLPNVRPLMQYCTKLSLKKFKPKFLSEFWSYYNSIELSLIRNKRLHKMHIDACRLYVSLFQTYNKRGVNQNTNWFNFHSFIGYKYYLARRSHNVLWVKTQYLKAHPFKEGKYSFNYFGTRHASADYHTTR
jgi:hypothetical protein